MDIMTQVLPAIAISGIIVGAYTAFKAYRKAKADLKFYTQVLKSTEFLLIYSTKRAAFMATDPTQEAKLAFFTTNLTPEKGYINYVRLLEELQSGK